MSVPRGHRYTEQGPGDVSPVLLLLLYVLPLEVPGAPVLLHPPEEGGGGTAGGGFTLYQQVLPFPDLLWSIDTDPFRSI